MGSWGGLSAQVLPPGRPGCACAALFFWSILFCSLSCYELVSLIANYKFPNQD